LADAVADVWLEAAGLTAQSVFERSMPSDLIRGWTPVRVKKTRQHDKPELRF
jgi:hypothetical protein